MRLLNVDTLKLAEFFEPRIPPYAILSHTWAEEEVLFADISSPVIEDDVRLKDGFQKIVYTCNQARQDGLEWAWIDTCCIDKKSSAELSEAINSMFRWYQEAEVCYAYLSDVSIDDFEETLPKSRWFTRGWTLQELIAPACIEFYGHSFNHLGSKEGHLPLISSITGINKTLLQNSKKLLSFSIAARMSWAAKRETTRVEDIAYCLFGIFDVNLPLLYGEGPKAFLRLQEIMRSNANPSILAWVPTTSYWKRRPIFMSESRYGALADHPQCYEKSGKIIAKRVKEDETSAPQMTSRGLEVTLPVLQHQYYRQISPSYTGILDCHYDDNFSGWIGIPLCGFDNTFERSDKSMCIVSQKERDSATKLKITIGPDPDRSNRDVAPVNQCWLRVNLEASNLRLETFEFVCCRFGPRKVITQVPFEWNPKAQILTSETLRYTKKEGSRHLALLFRYVPTAFDFVVIANFQRPRGSSIIRPPLENETLSEKLHQYITVGFEEEDAAQLLNPQYDLPEGYTQINLSDKMHLLARQQMELVLNQWTYVIDVKVEKKSSVIHNIVDEAKTIPASFLSRLTKDRK